MHQNDQAPNDATPGDDDAYRRDRIDADPPYGPAAEDAVERFRRLLASLIARRILDDRHRPPASSNEEEN